MWREVVTEVLIPKKQTVSWALYAKFLHTNRYPIGQIPFDSIEKSFKLLVVRHQWAYLYESCRSWPLPNG